MAKTFEELEEEEMLERKKKLAGMQTLKDFRKEEERQKKANLRLSKVYDEQVYKPFLAGRTPQQVVAEKQASQKAQRTADVAKAREDMRSGKTSSLVGKAYDPNRKPGTSKQVFKAMVQDDPTQSQVFDTKKEAEDYLKSKGVKGAVAGVRMTGDSGEQIESAASLYKKRAEEGRQAMVAEKEKPEKERQRVEAAKNKAFDTRYERATAQYGREMDPKKLYEQNLAERGLRSPASGANTAERRRIQEENDRALMDDFRESQRAKKAAQLEEASFLEDAKRKGMPKTTLDKIIGGDSSNVSVRRKYFEGKENQKARDELKARAEERRARNAKQTTANPEAASYDKVEFTPKSTAAPIGVGTESLEYGQRPSRAGSTQQPFGMVPPQTVDRGVDFGALSEANVSGATVAPTTPPSPTPESTTATPTAPKAKTSKEVTQEDIQPGISEVRMPPKAEGESVSDYNKRANEEYERQVILPSLDEGTQGALLTAREINQELSGLFSIRYQSKENMDRYKQLQSEVKENRNVLKDKIKELRSERRKVAFSGGNQAELIDQQIATLNNELGTIEKFLF